MLLQQVAQIRTLTGVDKNLEATPAIRNKRSSLRNNGLRAAPDLPTVLVVAVVVPMDSQVVATNRLRVDPINSPRTKTKRKRKRRRRKRRRRRTKTGA